MTTEYVPVLFTHMQKNIWIRTIGLRLICAVNYKNVEGWNHRFSLFTGWDGVNDFEALSEQWCQKLPPNHALVCSDYPLPRIEDEAAGYKQKFVRIYYKILGQ